MIDSDDVLGIAMLGVSIPLVFGVAKMTQDNVNALMKTQQKPKRSARRQQPNYGNFKLDYPKFDYMPRRKK